MVNNSWLKKVYSRLVQGENFLRHFLLLIIRLYWGGMLFFIGVGKLINIHGIAHYFSTLDIPAPFTIALVTGIIECLGGLSLFIGLFTRVSTILLAAVFMGAYTTAHKAALINFFTNPSLFIMQDPYHYLAATLIILCFGPGLFSIDYWIEKRVYGKAF